MNAASELGWFSLLQLRSFVGLVQRWKEWSCAAVDRGAAHDGGRSREGGGGRE